MELKRTGHVLAGLLAALVVGYEVFVVVHIVTTGDLGAVLEPMAFFGAEASDDSMARYYRLGRDSPAARERQANALSRLR